MFVTYWKFGNSQRRMNFEEKMGKRKREKSLSFYYYFFLSPYSIILIRFWGKTNSKRHCYCKSKRLSVFISNAYLCNILSNGKEAFVINEKKRKLLSSFCVRIASVSLSAASFSLLSFKFFCRCHYRLFIRWWDPCQVNDWCIYIHTEVSTWLLLVWPDGLGVGPIHLYWFMIRFRNQLHLFFLKTFFCFCNLTIMSRFLSKR